MRPEQPENPEDTSGFSEDPDRGDPADHAAPFAGVPEGLDPLSRALRVQQRTASVGFDWPDVRGALAKLREEIEELEEEWAAASEGTAEGEARAGGTVPDARLEEEAGDLLFAAVNVARLAGPHPETALAAANRKFERRFADLLRRARERGIDPSEASLEELEALWVEGKEAEAGPGGD